MSKLTFNIPGASSQGLAAPSGIPEAFQGDVNTTQSSVFQTSINLLFLIATTLALIIIIFSGIQWTTSGGEVDKIAAAKTRLKFALIGLVVVLMSFFIVTILVRVLGGNTGNVFNPGGYF